MEFKQRQDHGSKTEGEVGFTPAMKSADLRIVTTEGDLEQEMFTPTWYIDRLNDILRDLKVPLSESIHIDKANPEESERQAALLKRSHWEDAHDKYVGNEASPELAVFSSIMLHAGEAVFAFDRHEYLDKVAHRTEKENKQKQACLETLVKNNHELRQLIDIKGEHFTLSQLSSWYAKAMGGNVGLATSWIYGAAAEVAAMTALNRTYKYHNAKYASLKKDLQGCDIQVGDVPSYIGDMSVDIKVGQQPPVAKRAEDGCHVTLGIPEILFDKYGNAVDGIEIYVEDSLDRALKTANHAKSVHHERPAYTTASSGYETHEDIKEQAGAIGFTEPIAIKLPHSGIIEALRRPKNEYLNRAELIIDEIQKGLAKHPQNEVIDDLREKYLYKSDDDIELQRLTQVMLRSRQQSDIQDALNADRTRLHDHGLTHEEKISVGAHYEMLRHEACEFNHALRTLMENNGKYFTRDQLTGWIGKASHGHYRWAEGEITGAASEIAVHAALQGLPELKGVRYGTIAEDLAGYDFVCVWMGSLLSVDAKTGHYPPVEEIKHGHRHIEVSVPREIIKGFNVTRKGLAIIRFDIRHALSIEANMAAHNDSHFIRHNR
jgi:hypothetical protein